jgi:hypothetical protein
LLLVIVQAAAGGEDDRVAQLTLEDEAVQIFADLRRDLWPLLPRDVKHRLKLRALTFAPLG